MANHQVYTAITISRSITWTKLKTTEEQEKMTTGYGISGLKV